jgi:aryl-alcohol dehydrogenase-like predicted oxidoreductase
MIPRVRLERSGIDTSRLGFGSSRLHYVAHRDRQRLLAAAADLGIIHFDTAPAYGDGIAEAELAEFIRRRRAGFVIATKYGIPADPVAEAWPALARPLRAARWTARRLGSSRRPLPPLTPAGLRRTLQRSLSRLGTDYVDILLLHEPRRHRVGSLDALVEALLELKQSGAVRAFGLAGEWVGVAELLAAAPALGMVVQTPENEWPAETPPDITYGAVAGGVQSYFSPAIAAPDAVRQLLSAWQRRKNGVVLVSTTRAEHLRQLADAIAGAGASQFRPGDAPSPPTRSASSFIS